MARPPSPATPFIAQLNDGSVTSAANTSPQRAAVPLFTHEGADLYGAAYAHNASFAKPGSYETALTPQQAKAFEQWVSTYRIPVTRDYDMRGYFLASGGKPHTQGQHFPDTFKTPYDTSFSGQSKYARPGTPFVWVGNNLVDSRSGRLIFSQR